jgi:Holliday junction resolvase
MTEQLIVRKIMSLLKKRGAWAMKTHGSPMSSGYPDIIACYKGFFIAFEVKQPSTSRTATARQLAQIKLINKAHGRARIVVSPEEVEELLDELDLWVGI